MSKEAEKNYLKNIGEGGIKHVVNKPFSDNHCGSILAELSAIISLIPSPPAKLLDLGCGTGWTSKFFADRGYEVVGQDISIDMIELAKKDVKNNLDFIVSDYEEINFFNEFDIVIFFDSLHHSTDEVAAIKSAHNALRPGGICIFSEPGLGHSKAPNSINAMKKYGVNERDMPPQKIIKTGKRIGFKNVKIYPRLDQLSDVLYQDKLDLVNFKFMKSLFRFNFIKSLAVILIVFFYKKQSGIVLMIK